MQRTHNRVLVLNADYLPLGLISWKRAIVLSMLNQVEVVDFYKNDYINGTNDRKYPVPAVIRCITYIRPHKRTVAFSRKNVFIRDQITCQYCGYYDGTTELLTYDHVIPRDIWKKKKYSGTPTNWLNVVTCCQRCNRKKANRTPEQANMRLLRPAKEPSSHGFILGFSPWMKVPKEWEFYLPTFYREILRKKTKKGV